MAAKALRSSAMKWGSTKFHEKGVRVGRSQILSNHPTNTYRTDHILRSIYVRSGIDGLESWSKVISPQFNQGGDVLSDRVAP